MQEGLGGLIGYPVSGYNIMVSCDLITLGVDDIHMIAKGPIKSHTLDKFVSHIALFFLEANSAVLIRIANCKIIIIH